MNESANNPETNNPETNNPETNNPETNNPETNNPETPESSRPASDEKRSVNHWHSLAEMLGAEPAELADVPPRGGEPSGEDAEASETMAPRREAASVEPDAELEAAAEPPNPPGPLPPRPPTDWLSLAAELGIEVEPVEPNASEIQEEAGVTNHPETEQAPELETEAVEPEPAVGTEGENVSRWENIWQDVDSGEPVTGGREMSDEDAEPAMRREPPEGGEPAEEQQQEEEQEQEKKEEQEEQEEEEEELVVEVSRRRSRRGRRRRSRKREDTETAEPDA
ncbi:MAG: hypothetical protein ACODAD_13490, partial [Planctomycetota bacterium]